MIFKIPNISPLILGSLHRRYIFPLFWFERDLKFRNWRSSRLAKLNSILGFSLSGQLIYSCGTRMISVGPHPARKFSVTRTIFAGMHIALIEYMPHENFVFEGAYQPISRFPVTTLLRWKNLFVSGNILVLKHSRHRVTGCCALIIRPLCGTSVGW